MLAGGGACESLHAQRAARRPRWGKDIEKRPSDQRVCTDGAAQPGRRGIGEGDGAILADEHAIRRLLDQDSIRFARHVQPRGLPSGWITAGEVVTGKMPPETYNAGTV